MDIHSVSVYENVERIRGIFTLQYKFHYLQLNNGLSVPLAFYISRQAYLGLMTNFIRNIILTKQIDARLVKKQIILTPFRRQALTCNLSILQSKSTVIEQTRLLQCSILTQWTARPATGCGLVTPSRLAVICDPPRVVGVKVRCRLQSINHHNF